MHPGLTLLVGPRRGHRRGQVGVVVLSFGVGLPAVVREGVLVPLGTGPATATASALATPAPPVPATPDASAAGSARAQGSAAGVPRHTTPAPTPREGPRARRREWQRVVVRLGGAPEPVGVPAATRQRREPRTPRVVEERPEGVPRLVVTPVGEVPVVVARVEVLRQVAPGVGAAAAGRDEQDGLGVSLGQRVLVLLETALGRRRPVASVPSARRAPSPRPPTPAPGPLGAPARAPTPAVRSGPPRPPRVGRQGEVSEPPEPLVLGVERSQAQPGDIGQQRVYTVRIVFSNVSLEEQQHLQGPFVRPDAHASPRGAQVCVCYRSYQRTNAGSPFYGSRGELPLCSSHHDRVLLAASLAAV